MNINDLHIKFQKYGKNAKEWLRKCALLLPDIEKYQVWKQKGFSSIYEYAFKLASMSKYQVEDALRILKRVEGMPKIMNVVKIKGLNAVRPISTIVTEEDQDYWGKQAMQMSKNELEVFVRDTRISQSSESNAENLEKLTIHLKPETAAKLKKLNNGNWNELMEKFIKLYEENLEKELQESKPEKVKTTSRHVPNKIKRYILKRSHGKCEFPNCQKKYNQLHHTERFAAKQTHDPDKIIALCKAHHNLAHRGLIEEKGTASNWRIRRGIDYTTENFYIDSKVQFHRRV